MNAIKVFFGQVKRYPTAIVGLGIISLLIILAIYTLIALPYAQAITLWRGGENIWGEYPRNARPAWLNILPWNNMSETIIIDSSTQRVVKERRAVDDGEELHMELVFDFPYDTFPQEVAMFITGKYESRSPYMTIDWKTADGRTISLGDRAVTRQDTYRISQDTRLSRRISGLPAEIGLFGDPFAQPLVPKKGSHKVTINATLFEAGSDIDVKLIMYGEVHGFAGTDHLRRNIMVALMWGAPIALAFGLLASVGSSVTTMIIAAIGVWYGKWLDVAIQRITEINLILPLLPLLIMVGTFYSRSIWVMLGLVVCFSIFSSGIKTYRAMFLQVKESPYIEAARAYGAGGLRIVFRYMIPRILPVLVPGFVVSIPGYVFLEATLAALGLGDPILPTWGKLLDDARTSGALYNGYYYWMIQPAVLLMITGLGFSMLGFALDRIFNPRLREL
jgi:peptide/nickel transport system permease protein